MRRARFLLIVLAGLGLIAASCGSDSQTTTETSSEASLEPTADGGQIDLGSLEGTDTVLWFWAPW